MTEKITIDNFACIQRAEIDFNKITILIGPQATGKSIIAKLLYFFKRFPSYLIADEFESGSKKEIDKNVITTFEKYFPTKYFVNQPFEIKYYNYGLHITITNKNAKGKTSNPRIEYSDTYNQIRLEYKKNIRHFNAIASRNPDHESDLFEEDPSMKARSKVISKYSNLFDFPIFIPAGRSFYSNIEKIIFTLLSKNQDIDPFLQEFGSFYENIKKRTWPKRTLTSAFESLREAILRGEFYQDKGKDFIKYKDGRIIEMTNASSGQQEALPLYFALSWLLNLNTRSLRNRTIFIEEPEAHIFPDAQNLLVEAIGAIFNRQKNNLSFVITTHSPYILSTFNNLSFASTVVNDRNLQTASSFINTKSIISSENLSAYSTSNKGLKKIICGESGLIDAEAIDSISTKISKQFDNLLSLMGD